MKFQLHVEYGLVTVRQDTVPTQDCHLLWRNRFVDSVNRQTVS